MHLHKRSVVLLPLAAVLFGLSGCGSSGSDDSSADGTDPTAVESDAPTEDAGDASDSESDGDDTGASTGDVGSGVVTVDGVEYGDFAGECHISRGLDPETYLPIEVGDLSEPGLLVVAGIDNVASSPEVEANFIMTTGTNFRMVGIGGDGTIDSIAYVGSDTPGDVAEVAFSGTTEAQQSVVAEIVCEIGLD
jgi:hypothetical protein